MAARALSMAEAVSSRWAGVAHQTVTWKPRFWRRSSRMMVPSPPSLVSMRKAFGMVTVDWLTLLGWSGSLSLDQPCAMVSTVSVGCTW